METETHGHTLKMDMLTRSQKQADTFTRKIGGNKRMLNVSIPGYETLPRYVHASEIFISHV